MPSTFESEPLPASERDWRSDRATPRQLQYILDLGGQARDGMTKGQASELIDELLVVRPSTPRQRMLLRFYDRCDLETLTKEEVSVWLDGLYAERPEYERAWHLYKADVGHDNFSRDFMSVPIGAYTKYLRHRVPQGAVSGERPRSSRSTTTRLLTWALVLVTVLVICTIVFVLLR